MFRKLSVFIIFSGLMIASGAGAWSITDLEEPKSFDNVSNGTRTIQLIEVKDNSGDPVNETRLQDSSWVLLYNYSRTLSPMAHLGGGYWYANFTANSSATSIEYELRNTDPEGGEINTTETLTFDDYDVDILTDIERLVAGESQTMEVNVTDLKAGVSEDDDATVYLTITNGTDYSRTQLGYNNGLFTNIVTVPEYYGSDIAIHANAYNDSRSGSNSIGGMILPETTGNITYLNSSGGCNNNSFFTSCERTAEIETGFNSTILPADSVEINIEAPKKTGGVESLKNVSMEKNNGIWEAKYSVPDVNTSALEKTLMVHYNATIDEDNFLVSRNISYKSYTIRDKSDPSAFPGSNYRMKILFAKYHSLESLDDTRIERANVTLDLPNGSMWREYELSDFDYNEDTGLFNNEIDISQDAVEGNYDMHIEAENIYNKGKSRDSAFTIESASSSFNTTSSLEFNYSSSGLMEEEFAITNRREDALEISPSFDTELENISTFNDGDNLTLSGSETKNVSLMFDISSRKDFEGELDLSENQTDFVKTLDISINGPDCLNQNGTLCYDNSSMWINVTADDSETITRSVLIENLGDGDQEVTASVSGNLSEYLKVSPSTEVFSDQQSFELNYTSLNQGTYAGNISFSNGEDSIELKSKLTSIKEDQLVSVRLPSSISLSGVVRGGPARREVSVSNTGTVDITGLSISSEEFSAGIPSIETPIPSGESRTIQISFNDIQNESGQVTLSIQTSQDEIRENISVSVSLTDYETKIDQLESQIDDLQDRTESDSLDTELTDARARLTRVSTLYDQGRFEEAETQYEEVESKVNQIRSEVESEGSPDPPEENETETGGGPGDESKNEDQSSGSTILILGVVIFILLIIGFVFFTSYIPEEGDPLYSILGDG